MRSIARYAAAFRAELAADLPKGPLYADTLTVGLVLHLLAHSANLNSTPPQRPEGDSTQLFGQPVPVTSQCMSQFSHVSHITDPHAQGSDMSSRRLS